MKPFVAGQRVAAVIDGDIASAFGHGPQGTVGSYDPDQQTLAVTWDDGTQRRLPAETRLIRLTSNWLPAAGTGLSWQKTLQAVRAAGGPARTPPTGGVATTSARTPRATRRRQPATRCSTSRTTARK